MKYLLLTAASAALLVTPRTTRAADDLPQPIQLARYDAMMNRSPFAVATAPAATPPPAPNFAKDWYIANAARSPEGDLVTVASSTDKNFKEYLTTKEPVKGISISNIEWSDKVGATKVTITKDGQFSTLTFNQALLSQPIANAPSAPQPAPVQQPPAGGQPQVVPQPFPQVPGATPGANTPIKPAPIPTLPTPPPRVRSIIQRSPQAGAAPVPAPPDSQE
ncbi:MAG: Translation initiation factor 2 [uncultured Chthoniobacterales bacterium]|uniref:Translation initiation factor 2 n=1 Tax=uncultured Chthoniobacterales bacterium TaxID=1836801 RepID=A0A6J4GZ41_9BACT|nr:MAG: Translation initiation factor 2 [uncultured Chthoniobacterales bacterium]